jgi:hypothetical protein
VSPTDGPFEYYADLHAGVTAASIRSDAQNPGLDAATIAALAGELEGDSQQVAGQLSGDITADVQANPQTASDTAKQLAAKGHYAVGLVTSFAGMVDAFDGKVDDLNQRYRSDLATAMRWAGRAAAETPDTADDARVTEANMGPSVKANLQPEYNAAVAALDDDADTIAAKFNQGATNENVRELIAAGLIPLSAAAFYPGLELTTADKVSYWRNTLGQMSRQEQIDWVNQNKDNLPREAAAAIRPDVQEHFAAGVAADIEDPDDIDDDTVRLLTFFASEQPFAHRLYTDVSPDEMGDAIRTLSYDAFPYQDQRLPHERVPDVQLYKGFLDAAGVAFATYTKGTGSYAPPSNLADTWARAIIDEENPENAAALTLLIRHGGDQTSFDDRFITDVTGKVYEWERSFGGDAVWGPLSQRYAGDGNEYGIKDPSVDLGDPDDPYDDFTSGRAAYDGLANLLAGMEHNHEGAKDFFMGSYAGSTETMEQKIDYLIGGEHARTFAVDDGDGLGKALEAAIVGGDTRDKDDTAIANELFHTIAEHSGVGDSWVPHDDRWHVWNGMTDSLGTIAAGYSGDIYDMLSNTPPESGDTHLDLSPSELTKVLGEIGHSDDKTGLETLTAAELMECRNRDMQALGEIQGPHTLSALESSGYLGVQQTNGDVMGNLLHYGLEIAADEDKTAEARAAMLAKGLDIVAGFVPGAGDVLGEGASELAKTSYDIAKGETLSAIKGAVEDSAGSDTAEYRDNAVNNLAEKLRTNALSDLYRGEYLGPQDTSRGRFDGVSDLLFTGDPPSFRPELVDSNGYDLDDTSLSEQEKAAILAAYREFKRSPAWDLAYENTYSGNFYDRVEHPTPLQGE